MSISLYDVTVPVLLRGLRNLEAVLRKGESFAAERGRDPDALVAARLAPDMYPLSGQVQRASDTAKFVAVRLGGVANVPFEDDEKTFADLQARIAKTVAFLQSAPREAIDAAETIDVTLKSANGERHFTGTGYALGFALPNFFFHVTTAYAILRNQGVAVGKSDYLGRE